MSTDLIVLVGYGKLLLSHLERHVPPKSVIVVEDPDIIGPRSVLDGAARFDCVAEVVAARYHQDDPDCVTAIVRRPDAGRVLAVIPGLEYGVAAAATLADELGRPGATPAAAARLADKIELRRAAEHAGIRQPRWREVHGPAGAAEFATGGPYVLKPANRHASLGVQLLEPHDDVPAAWARAVSSRDELLLPDRELRWRYLVESRVHGAEHSVEAVVAGGRIGFLNVTAKQVRPGRHPVELGHVLPAPLPDRTRAELAAAMALLVDAVGFRDGLLHAEWMLTEDGPTLIECAGRAPGDSIVDLVDLAYGGSLVADVLAVLSGTAPPPPRAARRGAAVRFLTARPGRVTAVEGLDEARRLLGVVRLSSTASVGAEVGEVESSWDRLGEIVAVGPDAAAATDRAAAAAAAIDIEVEALPVGAPGTAAVA